MSGSPRARRWNPAWIGLGSNLGDRLALLAAAVRALRSTPDIRIGRISGVWKSAPVEVRRQPWFLNAAVRISTRRSPARLLARLKAVERALGRRPGRRYGPRVIDLDLLLFGARVIATPGLTVPHPGLARRAFALAPIAAVSPNLRHPVLGAPVSILLRRAPGRARRLSKAEERRFSRWSRRAPHE